jgi:hypothetical protein
MLVGKAGAHREHANAGFGELPGLLPGLGRITHESAAWHAVMAELWTLSAQPALARMHMRLALEQVPSIDVLITVRAMEADAVRSRVVSCDAVAL